MSGEEWRRGVHAELDGYFAARRGGTLPQARVPEDFSACNLRVGAVQSSATPQPGKVETSLPRKGGQMSAGSTSQSYGTVAPSNDSRKVSVVAFSDRGGAR